MLAATYSTASAEAVEGFVAEAYALPGPVRARLLHRGINDVFAVRAADGGDFVLRLSNRDRLASDVAAETAFLAHLDASGLPVAAGVPCREGRLFRVAGLPGGARPAVLFRHADGRVPGLDDPADARLQGAALARIHDAADGFPGREDGPGKVDLEHMLHIPAGFVLALGLEAPAATGDFEAVVQRLAAMVAARPGLTLTRCHGDCHGLNARITADGRAVFFDFDDGGYGYLAYDLAVHLWAQVTFGRTRHRMWHAFVEGYRAVRSIAPGDFEAVGVFVAIRHIWLMGKYASRVDEWGTEILPVAWLEREVAFLSRWERERLGRLLV